ncbi:MAG: dephospho-CoA kinase [Bacteroidetes bacterium]|nr:MAG: dephospho-CoA kinase [Bacteroidota bacterium]
MLKIGITGGIGSGKSTVSKIFETLNIPVFYADDRAKTLMVTNNALIADIKEQFGNEAYNADGNINREYISNIVFKDEEKRNLLNNLVHPKVSEDFDQWLPQQESNYVIEEAALLYESGSYKKLDKIIVVSADEDLRIKRIIARDNCTIEKVRSIINAQMNEAEKVQRADFIIDNNEKQLVIPQVLKFHEELLALAI